MCVDTAYTCLEANFFPPKHHLGLSKFLSNKFLITYFLVDTYAAFVWDYITLLALFDVSMAFDTVDQGILFEHL